MANTRYEKQILEDGIVIFKATAADPETVDAWFNDVREVFAHANAEGKPARLLYDFRNIGVVPAYGIQRAGELERLQLPGDWRTATLVRNAFLANMVNYIISVSMLPEMRNKSHVFADLDEALAWLRQP